mmetsp:Transcript_14049/g.17077  ORF Transcript_14049/g.17077 Transcript_14049/m.17077 type:complete len:239 (-) Transcript_14049:299-1015(-)
MFSLSNENENSSSSGSSSEGRTNQSESISPRYISLQACDNQIFRVTYEEAKISKLIYNALDDDDEDDDNEKDNDIDRCDGGIDGGSSGLHDEKNDSQQDQTNKNMNPTSTQDQGTVITLPKVNSTILTQIINFMKHYNNEPLHPITAPFQGSKLSDIITQEWYLNFIQSIQEKQLIFQLISSADFMDIESLLNLGCLVVSTDMMGKSAEEIRDILKIEKMSEEEELKAREDHGWMFSE